MIQELLRRRFGETIDLTIYDKALLIIKDEKLHDGNAYVLNLVDQWLNTQTSYENLESLTFWDDWIEQTLKRVVSALVLYARSLNLLNRRDATLMESKIRQSAELELQNPSLHRFRLKGCPKHMYGGGRTLMIDSGKFLCWLFSGVTDAQSI